MFRQFVLLHLLILMSSSVSGAQFSRGDPKPVELVVRVFYEGEQHAAGARLNVQLMDGFGSLEGEKLTNEEGVVQFPTVSGIHRLRVTGPEIVEYNGKVEIETVEMRRVEIVRVRPKSAAGLAAPAAGGTIPAVRLNIPANAQKEFRKGTQALERKDWEEARRRFKTAVSLYPSYDVAYNSLGVAAMSSGDVEGARRAFETAIKLNDNYSGAYRNLARILFAEHKYAAAETLLMKSLEGEPLNTWALTYLAYAQLLTQKFDEAVVNARKVHTLPHEGFANAHFIAARALEATGRPEQALAEYHLYLKEDPSGPNAARARDAVKRITNLVTK